MKAKKQIELECLACGLVFFATRDDKKTCTPKCRKAWSRALAHLRETNRQVLAGIRPPTCVVEMSHGQQIAPE